ncbi:MAG TPA: hypothetical protein ENI27_10180 [bacterium]|nr:hypothetical protein [bacterium]
MIETRIATEADIKAMSPLLEHWIAHCNPEGYKLYPKVKILQATFRSLLNKSITTTIVMVQNDDLIIGVMGVVLHGWGACEQRNWASESLWYVYPSRVGYTRTLLNAACAWAKDHGADYFIVSSNRLSGPNSERMGKMFVEKLGFDPLYRLYIKELSDV